MTGDPGRAAFWPRMIASFGGCGFAPSAPGTVGSLAAMPFGYALLQSPPFLVIGIVAVSVIGWVAIGRASGGADHGWIVIDEVAGIWITLLGLVALPGLAGPHGLAMVIYLVLAFGLFRLLDISKPGLIGRIDRRHDAFGVMGDDMLAGIVGALLLLAVRLAPRWMQ